MARPPPQPGGYTSAALHHDKADGRHLASAKLQPSAGAATLRARDGESVVTDGPFVETKEQLGGYHLVECADRDEALSLASRIPTLRAGGAIEVREIESTH